MPRKTSPISKALRNRIQIDRNDGMAVTALVKKYGISSRRINAQTSSPRKPHPKRIMPVMARSRLRLGRQTMAFIEEIMDLSKRWCTSPASIDDFRNTMLAHLEVLEYQKGVMLDSKKKR